MQRIFSRAGRPRLALLTMVWLLLPGKVLADTSLSLRQALQNTLQHHPTLQTYPYEVRALEAERLQADLRPNSTLSAEIENVLGTGDSRGLTSAQLTLSFGQLIELGDKRQQRLTLAQQRLREAAVGYEADRLQVLVDTAAKFYQVLKWQQLLDWNQQRLVQSRELLETIRKRADAGAVSAADVSRMAYQLARMQLAHTRLQGEFDAARFQLGQMWLSPADFSQVEGDTTQLPTLPDETTWQQAVNRAPDFLLLEQQVRSQQAQLALEQARGVADMTVSAGLRHNAGSDDSALVLGFSMPLHLQDPNRGNIAAARARMDGLTQQQALLRQSLRSQVAALYAQMQTTARLTEQLQQTLLPGAEQLLTDSRQSYQNGQISVLQLLDAQQALFEARRQLLETRISQLQLLLAMQGLTGQSLLGSADNE
ncbi:TolC family protein [Bowmanella dokdonensis]|uniref:TolC family protein n=1 Tax=Bowmanella dokdonensis TaxID=751969 RepID=A0A939IPV0_9ALTE|nr:TolC family protein [Bowmanella dokdonensis]MBN7826245.1 TolC family protein [Bowmanella dokdonensis]